MAGDDPEPPNAWDAFITGDWALVIALLCCLFACAMSLLQIRRHLRAYVKPMMQRSIVRILFIVPLYATLSFCSLLWTGAALYFNLIRDIYEAYVIYLFFKLMCSYAGGYDKLAGDLRTRQSMKHPPPCCCLSAVPLGQKFLLACSRFVLQFVIAKPAMAFISIMFLIVGGEGLYDSPTYQWILFVVYNLTYTLALVGLFYLYLACGELIAPYNPVMKFLAVKSIVFMTYWQTVLVETLPVNYISVWNDFLLCCEMVVFSIMLYFAFGVEDFEMHKAMKYGTLFDPEHEKSSLSDVLDVTDVFDDVSRSFGGRQKPIDGYQGVGLLDDEGPVPRPYQQEAGPGPQSSSEAILLS